MSTLHSSNAPKPVGAYPHARRAGNLLFLSGVGPRQPGTNEIPGLKLGPGGEIESYDLEQQVRAVMENVKTILTDAGAGWEHLVDVTVYLTNMKRDFALYNRIYAEYFPDPLTQPCRTTVEVGALPTPIAIELKCIAYLPLTADQRP
ncbi:MAG: RidA family protein [Cyclobacteriaceae bacterium]|nr:RidA family protein [Cyclobacteriaceae bacterium]